VFFFLVSCFFFGFRVGDRDFFFFVLGLWTYSGRKKHVLGCCVGSCFFLFRVGDRDFFFPCWEYLCIREGKNMFWVLCGIVFFFRVGDRDFFSRRDCVPIRQGKNMFCGVVWDRDFFFYYAAMRPVTCTMPLPVKLSFVDTLYASRDVRAGCDSSFQPV
jgi:hypothetical protein